jgi:hypothetical protein
MSGPLRVQWARSTQQPRASAIGTRDGDRQHLDSVGSSGRYEQISMLGSKSRQAKHQQEATHLRHLDATVSISNLDSSISLLKLHFSEQLWELRLRGYRFPISFDVKHDAHLHRGKFSLLQLPTCLPLLSLFLALPYLPALLQMAGCKKPCSDGAGAKERGTTISQRQVERWRINWPAAVSHLRATSRISTFFVDFIFRGWVQMPREFLLEALACKWGSPRCRSQMWVLRRLTVVVCVKYGTLVHRSRRLLCDANNIRRFNLRQGERGTRKGGRK